MDRNPLLDEEFLKELYLHRQREIFAKIIALTLDEDPIEEIQGVVTGGSVSLDGASNVRRSCSLSLVAKNQDINQYYWGLKTKFKLFIGLTNTIGWGYEDIIWFPMGMYSIANFSTSQSTNSYTISITGKDKMCLLNGELSGSLFASVDFGKEEYYDKKTKLTTITSIPIKNIIREAVHAYANEPWENIIVNDLDDYGIELLDYKGASPMYLFFREGTLDNTKDCDYYSLSGDELVFPVNIVDGQYQQDANGNYIFDAGYYYIDNTHKNGVKLSEIEKVPQGYHYDKRVELNFSGVQSVEPTRFCAEGNSKILYTISEVTNGQTCGYRLTNITYPGDLILGVGEPITAMLDKLVAMLGNFEYFYNVEGKFVFQRKQTFVDKTWNNIRTGNQNSYVTSIDETYVESAAYVSPVTWTFGDSFLVTSYSNSPVLSHVKNDFSIWGTKKSITNSELPVHLRYAVDKKPTYYKTLQYLSKIKDSAGKDVVDDEGNPTYELKGGVEWTTEPGQWWILRNKGIVDTSYEELAEQIKQEKIKERAKKINRKLAIFKLDQTLPPGLTAPEKIMKGENKGAWTPGWWDIEQWHKYYQQIYNEAPTDWMNHYATRISDLDTLPLPTYQDILNLDKDTVFTISHPNVTIEEPKNTNAYWLFDLYTTKDKTNGKIGYHVENMHDGPPGYSCGHSFNQFEQNVIAYNEAAKRGNPLPLTDWNNRVIDENRVVIEAHTYFYNPAVSQESDNTFFKFIEDEATKQIDEEITEDEIWNEIHEKGYRFINHDKANVCDWREIIFQMALDYRKHNHEDNFYTELRLTNGLNLDGDWYYPGGRTGYEQYYTDMEGFWRQLYCPPQLMESLYPTGVWTNRDTGGGWEFNTGAIVASSDDGIYFSTSEGIVYNLKGTGEEWEGKRTWAEMDVDGKWINSWVENQDINDGWNVQIIESPETINFWFDFLDVDSDTDLSKYSVPAIGDRAKSVNDSNVKAIYFRETPTALFSTNIQTIDRKSGYTYLQYQPEMINLFNVSSQGKSAYDVMEEYINLYLYAVESISISAVPIYHLQPNTKIMVYDNDSKINGDYLVSRISYPLTYNGTMSITATKSAKTIY